MDSYKARVYYDLGGMPHTWVSLSTPDGASETRGFAPEVYSPVWKGTVNDDSGHEWTLYRQYDITETQYREMKSVIGRWEEGGPAYALGRRDCRDLVHEVMEKRGGYDGADEYAFNSQSRIGFTVDGIISIFKELARDQGLVNDIAAKISSQGDNAGLLDVREIQAAFEGGNWPGLYGPDDDSCYVPPGMAP